MLDCGSMSVMCWLASGNLIMIVMIITPQQNFSEVSVHQMKHWSCFAFSSNILYKTAQTLSPDKTFFSSVSLCEFSCLWNDMHVTNSTSNKQVEACESLTGFKTHNTRTHFAFTWSYLVITSYIKCGYQNWHISVLLFSWLIKYEQFSQSDTIPCSICIRVQVEFNKNKKIC